MYLLKLIRIKVITNQEYVFYPPLERIISIIIIFCKISHVYNFSFSYHLLRGEECNNAKKVVLNKQHNIKHQKATLIEYNLLIVSELQIRNRAFLLCNSFWIWTQYTMANIIRLFNYMESVMVVGRRRRINAHHIRPPFWRVIIRRCAPWMKSKPSLLPFCGAFSFHYSCFFSSSNDCQYFFPNKNIVQNIFFHELTN